MEAPTEEEAFWPFGPTDESVDTSGLFGSFGDVSGEEIDDLLSMVEEEPMQQLEFREHVVGGSTAMTLIALVMVAILHYLWLTFGNSPHTRMVKNTYRQPKVFGGITSTEDGSTLTIDLTARPRTGCSNDSINVLVDGGASDCCFNHAIIPGFRDRLEEYNVLIVPQKISTAGGG